MFKNQKWTINAFMSIYRCYNVISADYVRVRVVRRPINAALYNRLLHVCHLRCMSATFAPQSTSITLDKLWYTVYLCKENTSIVL